jgi:carbamoyl-phosphate synthase large subunit
MTAENLLAIVEVERQKGTLLGVIVQFGGQTALKLAKTLHENNIPILGTSFDGIDLAEDRERFQKLLHQIDLRQPQNTICYKVDEVKAAISKINYPVVIRPSNILGGRAMAILHNEKDLDSYISTNGNLILDGPILVDKFLENAVEIDVDLISDGSEIEIVGIMEHVEEAGIHSGDSACSIPPYSLTKEQIKTVEDASIKLAKALKVHGMLNIQFAIQNNTLYVIEANPRASRTVPFVVKATGVDVVKIATNVLIGKKLTEFNTKYNMKEGLYAVKEVTIPFTRFNSDVLLTPEMRSTGESMGLGRSFSEAFYKAQLAVHPNLKKIETALISIHDKDKNSDMIDIARKLVQFGIKIYATPGTSKFLAQNGVVCEQVPYLSSDTKIETLLKSKHIHYVINTDATSERKDEKRFRREVLMQNVYYNTTIRAAKAMVDSIIHISKNPYDVIALQDCVLRK